MHQDELGAQPAQLAFGEVERRDIRLRRRRQLADQFRHAPGIPVHDELVHRAAFGPEPGNQVIHAGRGIGKLAAGQFHERFPVGGPAQRLGMAQRIHPFTRTVRRHFLLQFTRLVVARRQPAQCSPQVVIPTDQQQVVQLARGFRFQGCQNRQARRHAERADTQPGLRTQILCGVGAGPQKVDGCREIRNAVRRQTQLPQGGNVRYDNREPRPRERAGELHQAGVPAPTLRRPGDQDHGRADGCLGQVDVGGPWLALHRKFSLQALEPGAGVRQRQVDTGQVRKQQRRVVRMPARKSGSQDQQCQPDGPD